MTDTTTGPTAPDMPAPTGPRRARSTGAALMGVVAVLCLVGGLIGFWTVRSAFDSERFEHRVEDLLLDEETSDALARRVVTDIATGIGLRDSIDRIVPDALDPAIDLLLAGVRARAEDLVGELIRTREVAANIAVVAGRAHETAVAVLEGDDALEGVDVSDGVVRINLIPLTTRALRLLQDEFGLFPDIVLPEMDRSGDPGEQRAALETALDRQLPPEFGTPIVFQSDRLDEIGTEVDALRDLFTFAQRAFWLLLIAGVALTAASIWMSAQRWRTAAHLVAGMFATVLVFRVVAGVASSRLPETVESPEARATVRSLADGLAHDLNQTLLIYATLSLMILVAATVVLLGAPWAAQRRSTQAGATTADRS